MSAETLAPGPVITSPVHPPVVAPGEGEQVVAQGRKGFCDPCHSSEGVDVACCLGWVGGQVGTPSRHLSTGATLCSEPPGYLSPSPLACLSTQSFLCGCSRLLCSSLWRKGEYRSGDLTHRETCLVCVRSDAANGKSEKPAWNTEAVQGQGSHWQGSWVTSTGMLGWDPRFSGRSCAEMVLAA